MKNIFSKLLLLIITFLVFPSVSFAQIVINEIMYAPAAGGGEWIEIFNSGDTAIDLSDWRFFNNRDDSAPLRIQKGSATLASGGYAIITTSSYWDSFVGTVFTSSQFSLPDDSSKYNTYKAISDPNKQVIDFVTYDTTLGGNKDSGNSLQKFESQWIAASPTPGEANLDSNQDSGNKEEVSRASSDSSYSNPQSFGGSATNISSFDSQLEVSSGGDRAISVGSPIWFQATVKKNSNTNSSLEFSWSFGDGNVGVGPGVNHIYKYPGDYVVVVTARAGGIFSVSRFKVKVIDSDISVSDKGKYLEISNNSNTETNLFNWKIENNGKGFIFQPNTIVLPHSSIKLDKTLLKMKGSDNSLGTSLKNYLGEEVFNVAPIKEVDLAEASKNLETIKKEFSLLQEKAINLGFGDIYKKNEKVYSPSRIVLAAMPEVLGEDVASATPVENIIYESPKNQGIFGRAWNFLRGVLR